jgi:hypothetical protein
MQYIIMCAFLLNACTAHLEPSAINPRYTPQEARNHIIWWAENIRPSQRSDFDKALIGDRTSLRSILYDTDNSFGPPNEDGDSASVLSGAFLLVLGDDAFAEFIRGESYAVKHSVFNSFRDGPWSLAYDTYTVPSVAESKFSRAFPKTAKIRNKFYADNSKRAQQAPSNR